MFCFLFFSFSGLDFQPYFSGLEFLPQFNTVFPIKRNTVGASMQGTRSSPLHAFVGSPIKEEEEHPNQDAEATKINLGRQESREPLKQVLHANSSHEWVLSACFLLSAINTFC